MSIWVLRGLRDGVVTTRWPARPDPYADSWRGPARPLAGTPLAGTPSAGPPSAGPPSAGTETPEALEALCPTGAISVTGGVAAQTVRVDQGKCILCGRCVAERPGVFAWSQGATGPGAAALTRDQLIIPELPETGQAVQAARARLRERTAALRRSLRACHANLVRDPQRAIH